MNTLLKTDGNRASGPTFIRDHMQITEDIRDYWNLRSSGFSNAVMAEMFERGENILEQIINLTKAETGLKVLDVGCGPGLLSMVLSRAGMDVVGIDYSEEMIKQAKSNAFKQTLDIDFMIMDAQNMSFEDCSFDIIVSRDVLWNLPLPEKAYEEMVRVLRPGGRGLVIDGNYYLHLFDEKYARNRHIPRDADRPNYHSEYNQDGVDFNIIADIAKKLPLSREERPAWDLRTLGGLGVSDISYQLKTVNADDRNLVVGFTEVFTKRSFQ